MPDCLLASLGKKKVNSVAQRNNFIKYIRKRFWLKKLVCNTCTFLESHWLLN